MRFSDVPGLGEIKYRLIRMAQTKKIVHAQLFAGQEGTLNLPMALAYATYLHCQNRRDDDACGLCAACHKSLKYIHPDTQFVFPSAAIQTEPLKLWRAFLNEHPFGTLNDWVYYHGGENKHAAISREKGTEIIKVLSLKSFESPYKVVIVWQPELMHPFAANALLKTLEEPPFNTLFLLVSNKAEQLPATMLSRTCKIPIPLLSDDDMDTFLQQKTNLNERNRKAVLQWAEGNVPLALHMAENSKNVYQHQFSEWMRACFKKNYSLLVESANQFHNTSKTEQQNLLYYSSNMMRETLLHIADSTSISRATEDELKFIQDFSVIMDIQKIEKSGQIISDAAHYLEQNGSAKMVFMNLSLHFSALLNPNFR